MDCLFINQSKINPIMGYKVVEEEKKEIPVVRENMNVKNEIKIDRKITPTNRATLKLELSNSRFDSSKSSNLSSSKNSIFKRLSLKGRQKSELDVNDLLHFNIITKIKSCILLENEDIDTMYYFNVRQLQEIIIEFDALISRLNKKYEILTDENSNTANLNDYGEFDNERKQEDKILYKIYNLLDLSEKNYKFLKNIKNINYLMFFITKYKETFNMIAPFRFKCEINI
jgi:hypothetical protein